MLGNMPDNTERSRPGFDAAQDVLLDATTLRGIAHPLRVRILGVLREHGAATVTTLSRALGESTASMSYHLRQLAAYGFVVEDPDRGTGRERWWRSAHRSTWFDLPTDQDPEAEALGEEYLAAIARAHGRHMREWLTERTQAPREWREAATFSDVSLRLTAAESRQLIDEILELLLRHRRADVPGPAPAGSQRVSVQFQVLPRLSR
jgi:DNA-binding transcriptional ArsR family regulator